MHFRLFESERAHSAVLGVAAFCLLLFLAGCQIKARNESNFSFLSDSTGPLVALQDPAGPIRGGASATISYVVRDDASGVEQATLEFAVDGVNFVAVSQLNDDESSFEWTVPSADLSVARIRVTATDRAGNQAQAISHYFTIDSTPPAVPVVSLVSAAAISNASATLTIADCTGYHKIIVYEGLQPGLNDSGWTDCSSTPGATLYTLPSEGSHSLKVWARDAAGNLSVSTPAVSVTLDLTGPTPVSATLASGTPTASTAVTLTVASCTTSEAVSKILVTESTTAPLAGDAAWQNCSTSAAAIPYTLALATEGSHSLKVWAKDALGNVSSLATALSVVYDTAAPLASAVVFTDGATTRVTPAFAVNLAASDTGGSGVAYYRSSESSVYANSGWAAFGTGTSLVVNASFTNGAKTMYFWVKDAAGNVSTSLALNYTLQSATPPVVTKFIVANTNTGGAYPTVAQTNFANTSTAMYVYWTGTSSNGVAANPFSLAWSSDMAIWTQLSASFAAGISSGATDFSSGIASFNAPYASPSIFYVRLGITDSLGQTTYVVSAALNTVHWKPIAGVPGSGLGGSALSAKMTGMWVRGAQTLFYDTASSRLYLINGPDEANIARITYVDGLTGKWMDTGLSVNSFTGLGQDFFYNATSGKHLLYERDDGTGGVIKKFDLIANTSSNFHTSAYTSFGCGIATDHSGNLYTCDGANTIVKITVDANGDYVSKSVLTAGAAGDLKNAQFRFSPNYDYLYVKYWSAHGGVAKFNLSTGAETVVLSSGSSGGLTSLTKGRSGNELLLAKSTTIVALDGSSGAQVTLAGGGTSFNDNVAAASASLCSSEGIVSTPEGQIYFIDGACGNSFSPIRIRTIDGTSKVQTVGGTFSTQLSGTNPLASRFGSGLYAQTNPFTGKLYLANTSDQYVAILDTVGSSVSLVQDSGGSSKSGISAGGFAFLDSVNTLRFYAFSWIYGAAAYFNGTSFATDIQGSYANVLNSSAAALSACHGVSLTNCGGGTLGSYQMISSDGSGNAYFVLGGNYQNDASVSAAKVMKINAAGVLSQLMGSNTRSFTADGAVTTTSPLNPPGISVFVHYDSPHSRLYFVDYNGTSYLLRYLNAAFNAVTTVATLPNFSPSRHGAFDNASELFYYSDGQTLYSVNSAGIVATLSTVAPLTAPSMQINPNSGYPLILGLGMIYEYVP